MSANKTATFRRYVSDPATAECELHERAGQEVTILGELEPSTYDRAEVGTMYHVRFPDGYAADVFAEELTPKQATTSEKSNA